MTLLLATRSDVYAVDADSGTMRRSAGLDGRAPSCLAADPGRPGRAWCGTDGGVYRTDDGGASWRPAGLPQRRVTALAVGPGEKPTLWAGTEPSAVWRSEDGGQSWHPAPGLEALPSAPSWSFPPRPDTHHVRWIACHPFDPGRLWVAIEAGALISTIDGGRTWHDRVPGGPYDTHELAVHRDAPETLRVAAGDGYFESYDGGDTWARPRTGLEVGYLRSVAIDPGDPDTVLVSAATHAHAAYVAGSSDGRLYRREAAGPWKRVVHGWPDPPNTIAPLLLAGAAAGGLWAADERGLHLSDDGGVSWMLVSPFPSKPRTLAALVRMR